jgi:hypothetical protein
MRMPVTDDQVAALRAYLEGDAERYEAWHERVDTAGYADLLVAAFFEAVDRRFGQNGTKADVVEFVAGLRSRTGSLADAIDPRAAERLILAAFTDEDIADIDDKIKGGLYGLLLAALITDARLSGIDLDEFMAEARSIADHWSR